jgi:hypothetical protein
MQMFARMFHTGRGLRFSDFVSDESGHLQFHWVPIFSMLGFVALMITFLVLSQTRPDLVNAPMPLRYLFFRSS